MSELESVSELPQNFTLFSGDAHPKLGERIASELGVQLGKVVLDWHPSTEPYVRLDESVRGKHVVVIQPGVEYQDPKHPNISRSASDAFIQMTEMISAARQAHARRIVAVAPYMFGSRQDRRSMAREAVTVKNAIRTIQVMGAYSLSTVDLHTPQSLEIFDGPSDHMTAHRVLSDRLSELRPIDSNKYVVVGPDVGRAKLVKLHADHSDLSGREPLALYLDKDRVDPGTGKTKHSGHLPDLAGKTAFLIDDMVDRASTAVGAANAVAEAGAGPIYLVATHGFFNKPAVDRLINSPITKTFVTDTVPSAYKAKHILGERLEIVSVAPMLADVIAEIVTDGSLNEYFHGEHFR